MSLQTPNMKKRACPNLHRYFLDTKRAADFMQYYPKEDGISFEEVVFKYTDERTFKNAWYVIYNKNEGRIENFIRGDFDQLDHINFNLLIKLFFHAWPHTDLDSLYYKDTASFTLHDYLAVANRLWAINMFRT
jgi:hypothetical protein